MLSTADCKVVNTDTNLFIFDTGSHCGPLTGLELTMKTSCLEFTQIHLPLPQSINVGALVPSCISPLLCVAVSDDVITVSQMGWREGAQDTVNVFSSLDAIPIPF